MNTHEREFMEKLNCEEKAYYIQNDPFKPGYMIDCDFGMIKCRDDMPKSQVEANARLITAAPLMLKALKACVAQLDEETLLGPILNQAKAAITKATK